MKKLFLLFLFVHCILTIEDCGCQWVQMSNGLPINSTVNCFTNIGTNLFAGTSSNGVFLSSNNGENWISRNNGLITQNIKALGVVGNKLFAAVSLSGVYSSTNNGMNWVFSGLTNKNIMSFAVSEGKIYAGGSSGGINSWGIFVSSNSGLSWDTLSNNILSVLLGISGNNIYTATNCGGVYKSTNLGLSWNTANNGIGNACCISLAIFGNNIFVGTLNGIFLSTDNGALWTPAQNGITNNSTFSIVKSNDKLFAGTGYMGMYLSQNYGANWIQRNQGFPQYQTVFSLLVLNDYLFAGTEGSSIWRRNISEIIGINKIGSEIPIKFSLSQNYPNPFNPVTIIKYMIADNGKWKTENGLVTLKIYDVLGKEVATIVNEKQSPGMYEVTWDASQFPSGVYFYKLTAGDFSEVKKMILIK